MDKIGVGYASVTDIEKKYVMDALDNERLSQGKYVNRFEREFAQAHGKKYGVMCNSGTSALHLALETLKETEGWDGNTEILVPAITFIATSNACLHAGFKVVFVDVEKDTYNMDPVDLERRITERTKCVIPVHTFGMPCRMKEIMAIAKKHGLRVIEDCAEAHFARVDGETVGSFGDITCFSTYVAHTITTGVGGVVCTSDRQYMEILRSLVAHGRACTCERCIASDGKNVCPKRMQTDLDRRFCFERIGYSYRVGHTYMMFPIVIKEGAGIRQKDFVLYLEKQNIETRPMLPLLNQPIYRKLFGDLEPQYPNAAYIDHNGFYVGCHHGLGREQLDYIISSIGSFLEPYRK